MIKQNLARDHEIVVIDLWPREAECVPCGAPASGRLGVPMYEGQMVSGDGPEECAFFDACEACYELWLQEF